MSQQKGKPEDQRTKIIAQIAELSRLLGMIPSDDTIDIHDPMTKKRMALSEWLGSTRDSFFKLSLLVSQELDIQLR